MFFCPAALVQLRIAPDQGQGRARDGPHARGIYRDRLVEEPAREGSGTGGSLGGRRSLQVEDVEVEAQERQGIERLPPPEPDGESGLGVEVEMVGLTDSPRLSWPGTPRLDERSRRRRRKGQIPLRCSGPGAHTIPTTMISTEAAVRFRVIGIQIQRVRQYVAQRDGGPAAIRQGITRAWDCGIPPWNPCAWVHKPYENVGSAVPHAYLGLLKSKL